MVSVNVRASVVWAAGPLALLTTLSAIAAENSAVLEEVIVSAQKREESIQNVPLAVTALSGESLQERGIADVSSLAGSVPGLQISSQGDSVQIGIRGIASTNSVESGDPAAAFHVDGVYIGRPSSVGAVFYDVQRIEVLRGPQGTLYGRNATAGAVNVITNKPADRFESEVELEAGNFGLVRALGVLNTPVTDELKLRGAVHVTNRDGYFNSAPATQDKEDAEEVAARVHALWDPSASFSVLLSGDYFHRKGAGPGQSTVPLGSTPSWTASNDFTGEFEQEFWGSSLDINWQLPLATLSSITSFRDNLREVLSDQDNTDDFRDGIAHVRIRATQFTQELRLTSRDNEAVQWVTGLYYFHEKQDVFAWIENLIVPPLGGMPGIGLAFPQPDVKASSYAGFGQATIALGDAWRLTLGARYTQDEKSRRGGTFLSIGDNPTAILVFPNIADESWSKTTWKVGLDWDVNGQSMLYASVGTGYKAGGYYDGMPPNSYGPENLLAWALGSKNRFLDGRIQANAEAFLYDYEDYQVSQAEPLLDVPDPPQGLVTHNAGQARIYGLELETIFVLSEADRLDLTLAYLDTEFTKFELTPFIGTGTQVFTGNVLANSPDFAATLAYEHVWTFSAGASLSGRIQTYLSDGYFLEYTNDSILTQGSYTRSEAQLTYRSDEGRWRATGYVSNIEDETVKVSGTIDSVLGVPAYLSSALMPPRTYGLRVNLSF